MEEQPAKNQEKHHRSVIVCATRGGEASRTTEDRAIALARERDADLVFLYVVDASFAYGQGGKLSFDTVEDEVHAIGDLVLEQARRRARKQGIAARSEIRTGPVADEIQRFVEGHHHVDTLVVGHMSEHLQGHLDPVLRELQERRLEVVVVSTS
jgi:nucleotide-binding universal stress UspA family protein